MIGVERADYVSLPVRDLARAVAGVCYTAFFTDPDGNRLSVHRRYAN